MELHFSFLLLTPDPDDLSPLLPFISNPKKGEMDWKWEEMLTTQRKEKIIATLGGEDKKEEEYGRIPVG